MVKTKTGGASSSSPSTGNNKKRWRFWGKKKQNKNSGDGGPSKDGVPLLEDVSNLEVESTTSSLQAAKKQEQVKIKQLQDQLELQLDLQQQQLEQQKQQQLKQQQLESEKRTSQGILGAAPIEPLGQPDSVEKEPAAAQNVAQDAAIDVGAGTTPSNPQTNVQSKDDEPQEATGTGISPPTNHEQKKKRKKSSKKKTRKGGKKPPNQPSNMEGNGGPAMASSAANSLSTTGPKHSSLDSPAPFYDFAELSPFHDVVQDAYRVVWAALRIGNIKSAESRDRLLNISSKECFQAISVLSSLKVQYDNVSSELKSLKGKYLDVADEWKTLYGELHNVNNNNHQKMPAIKEGKNEAEKVFVADTKEVLRMKDKILHEKIKGTKEENEMGKNQLVEIQQMQEQMNTVRTAILQGEWNFQSSNEIVKKPIMDLASIPNEEDDRIIQALHKEIELQSTQLETARNAVAHLKEQLLLEKTNVEVLTHQLEQVRKEREVLHAQQKNYDLMGMKKPPSSLLGSKAGDGDGDGIFDDVGVGIGIGLPIPRSHEESVARRSSSSNGAQAHSQSAGVDVPLTDISEQTKALTEYSETTGGGIRASPDLDDEIIERLKKQLEDSEQRGKQTLAVVDQLQLQLAESEARIVALEQKAKQTEQEYDRQIEESKRQIDGLKENITLSEAGRKRLEQEYEKITSEVAQLQVQLISKGTSEEEIENIMKQLQESQAKEKQSSAIAEKLQNELDASKLQMQDEYQKLSLELADFKNRLTSQANLNKKEVKSEELAVSDDQQPKEQQISEQIGERTIDVGTDEVEIEKLKRQVQESQVREEKSEALVAELRAELDRIAPEQQKLQELSVDAAQVQIQLVSKMKYGGTVEELVQNLKETQERERQSNANVQELRKELDYIKTKQKEEYDKLKIEISLLQEKLMKKYEFEGTVDELMGQLAASQKKEKETTSIAAGLKTELEEEKLQRENDNKELNAEIVVLQKKVTMKMENSEESMKQLTEQLHESQDKEKKSAASIAILQKQLDLVSNKRDVEYLKLTADLAELQNELEVQVKSKEALAKNSLSTKEQQELEALKKKVEELQDELAKKVDNDDKVEKLTKLLKESQEKEQRSAALAEKLRDQLEASQMKRLNDLEETDILVTLRNTIQNAEAHLHKREVEHEQLKAEYVELRNKSPPDDKSKTNVSTPGSWQSSHMTDVEVLELLDVKQIAGDGASDSVKMLITALIPLASRTAEGRGARRREWAKADLNRSGQLSFSDFQGWIRRKLQAAKGSLYGRTLFDAYRPAYPNAFRHAHDVATQAQESTFDGASSDFGTMGTAGIGRNKTDGLISRAEFRLTIAHVCAYALMYDAFSKVAVGARKRALDEEYVHQITRDDFMKGFQYIASHGLQTFTMVSDRPIGDEESPEALFARICGNIRGVVRFSDWCTFLRKEEISYGTDIGRLLHVKEKLVVGTMYDPVDIALNPRVSSPPPASPMAPLGEGIPRVIKGGTSQGSQLLTPSSPMTLSTISRDDPVTKLFTSRLQQQKQNDHLFVPVINENPTGKSQETIDVTDIVGRSASDEVQIFILCFIELADRTTTADNARNREWAKADLTHDGFLSLSDVERWICRGLEFVVGLEKGKQLFRTYFPACIRAFQDAKKINLGTRSGIGMNKLASNDYVTRDKFRQLIANICAYSLMFDAFIKVDGGEGMGISLAKFLENYKLVSCHGLAGLSNIPSHDEAEITYSVIDTAGAGMVSFPEWCDYMRDAELNAKTKLGSILIEGDGKI